MKNRNVGELATEGRSVLGSNDKKEKQKTDKKYLKRAEKIVRKLDNALSELNNVAADIEGLVTSTDFNISEIADKDLERIEETRVVVGAAVDTLYHLTNRMARKYVGKSIDRVDNNKRKALKV